MLKEKLERWLVAVCPVGKEEGVGEAISEVVGQVLEGVEEEEEVGEVVGRVVLQMVKGVMEEGLGETLEVFSLRDN